MEVQSLITQSLLESAGQSRLPPIINIKTEVVDESNIMCTMEFAVYEHIQKIVNFSKSLHDKNVKTKILQDIINVINKFDFTIKSSFIRLWEIYILPSNQETETKEVIAKITEKILNKKVLSFIENNIRSSTKLTAIIKSILNISQSFEPIFKKQSSEGSLTKAEQIANDNIIRMNEKYTSFLDTFVEVINYSENAELNISRFFNNVRKISDARIRNQYYNIFLLNTISNMTIRVGKTIRPISNPVVESIFVQVYLYFINMETIKTIDSRITEYIKLKNINWFSYQVLQLTDILYPNWNFNVKGFVLDTWQKDAIRKIDEKKNLLLSLPTSAGKTIISTYTIRKYKKVCYIVPSEALAYQLTGIILASLLDIEKRGEQPRNVRQETASLQYQKYVDRHDDIIVGTPKEFYELLKDKKIDPRFDYIIIDEFHNINSDVGHYIEYILKFAGYFKIPVICLSATIPNYNFVLEWLQKILVNEVFGVYEIKRFYNQKRYVVKKEENLKLLPINVLDNMTIDTIRSDEFTHIGLYPKEIYELYTKLVDIPRKDEAEQSIVKLDDMFKLEQDIFKYLKSLSYDKLSNIVKDNSISTDSLTIFELYKVLKICKDTHKTPMLVFKMDPQKCIDIYHKMLTMLKEYQSIVYPGLYNDQEIIQKFYDTCALLNAKIDLGKKGNIELAQEKIKIEMFNNPAGTRAQLIECYDNLIKTKIDTTILSTFNNDYGANLTPDEIISLRTKHKTHQLNIFVDHERLYLSNRFQPHADCKLTDTSITYNDMRKIKRRIQGELTRNALISNNTTSVPKLNYEHPFLVGIEYGILCYNELLDPAFQRGTQQLINTGHAFITFTDKSLAVGINYPIKTVMLLGGLKDETIEDIDNTLAHQAIGRAGRRGLDAEGFIIYSGVNINNILIHKYKHIVRNNSELMKSLLTDETIGFANYVINEERPEIEESIWKADKYINIDHLAIMQFINMNQNIKLDKVKDAKTVVADDDEELDDDEINMNLINKYNNIDTEKILNEIKENIRKQIERHMYKQDNTVNSQDNIVLVNNNVIETTETTETSETTNKEKDIRSPLDGEVLESWEYYV